MVKHAALVGIIITTLTLQTQASAKTKVAPADEYFGRQKLSILGISNTIHDVGIRVANDPANGARYLGTLTWAEEALEDWARKYPQDGWLPQRAYTMSHLLWQLHTAEADGLANRCRKILFAQFANSRLSALARTESAASVAPLNVPVAANAAPKN
jgi:hypothetical protein